MLQNPELHYLDNAATTIVAPEVADVIDKAMREHWANPSSLYGPGARSEEALNAARAAVARTLGCKAKELYFTSCGSESNNLALLGAARTRTFGKDIVVSGFEHPSVQRPLEDLAKRGYNVTVVKPRTDGTLDINEYVRFATDAVRAKGPTEAAAAHARFMREVVQPVMTEAARALLQQHRDAGDEIVIVTATNEFVTRPIAAAFGVDELIAVQLEQAPGADGAPWITGNILGVPSAREGKVTRMNQWLAARGWGWDDVHTTFYSDSLNDLALLEKVNQPVATNPDARLRALAQERGWRILDLFPHA